MKPSITAVLAGCLTLAVAAFAVERSRLHAEQDRAGQLALAVSNDSASIDSTRAVSVTNAKLAKLAGDSLRVVQKLVVQTKQQADATDRALGLERTALYQFSARVDSLQRRVASTAPVTEDTATDTRRAVFDFRSAAFTIVDTTDIPAPPGAATLAIHVVLDPIPVAIRASCASPNTRGIRAASIEATSPAWASLQIGAVQQSSDLCASPALAASRPSHVRPALIGGVGKAVTAHGDVVSGWSGFVGAGFALSF